MTNWIKWWKSTFFLTLLFIALISVIIAFLSAYFLNGYWKLVSILVAGIGGFSMKKVIDNKINIIIDRYEKENRKLIQKTDCDRR